jgi:hypothetical protein
MKTSNRLHFPLGFTNNRYLAAHNPLRDRFLTTTLLPLPPFAKAYLQETGDFQTSISLTP